MGAAAHPTAARSARHQLDRCVVLVRPAVYRGRVLLHQRRNRNAGRALERAPVGRPADPQPSTLTGASLAGPNWSVGAGLYESGMPQAHGLVRDLVAAIVPADGMERAHQSDALAWLDRSSIRATSVCTWWITSLLACGFRRAVTWSQPRTRQTLSAGKQPRN